MEGGLQTKESTMTTPDDLRARVVALEQASVAALQRLSTIEVWQRNSEIAEARKSEQFLAMGERFTRIQGDLDKISATLARIMWLIISGILAGMVGFLIRGGFYIPT